MQAWPEDALELVAHKFLDDVEMTDAVREETVVMCKHFHMSITRLSDRYYFSYIFNLYSELGHC